MDTLEKMKRIDEELYNELGSDSAVDAYQLLFSDSVDSSFMDL